MNDCHDKSPALPFSITVRFAALLSIFLSLSVTLFFWINPSITPPTIEPIRIAVTHWIFPVTTGNTKNRHVVLELGRQTNKSRQQQLMSLTSSWVTLGSGLSQQTE